MNARLTRGEWEGVLETALTVARHWEMVETSRPAEGSPEEGPPNPQVRRERVREHVELEISTLELLHAAKEGDPLLIEVPEEVRRSLDRLLSS